jgi:hypothetical protein
LTLNNIRATTKPVDKINKIALSYLCCLPICNASFHGPNPYGYPETGAHIFKILNPPSDQPAPEPELDPSVPSTDDSSASPRPKSVKAKLFFDSLSRVDQPTHKREVIQPTQIIDYTNNHPVFKPEVLSQLPAPHDPRETLFPESEHDDLKFSHFLWVLDCSYKENGIRHVIDKHLTNDGSGESLFSTDSMLGFLSDDTKALLDRCRYDEYKWKSTLIYMFLNHCLYHHCASNYEKNTPPGGGRESKRFSFEAKFPKYIGLCFRFGKTYETEYVRIVFGFSSNNRLVLYSAYPTLNQP